MPTYSYACTACGHAFDIRQSFSDDALTVCPECGEPRLRKVIHPVGIAFKGSGFYKTDSRAGSPKGSQPSTGSDGAQGSDGSKGSDTSSSSGATSAAGESSGSGSSSASSASSASSSSSSGEGGAKTSAPSTSS